MKRVFWITCSCVVLMSACTKKPAEKLPMGPGAKGDIWGITRYDGPVESDYPEPYTRVVVEDEEGRTEIWSEQTWRGGLWVTVIQKDGDDLVVQDFDADHDFRPYVFFGWQEMLVVKGGAGSSAVKKYLVQYLTAPAYPTYDSPHLTGSVTNQVRGLAGAKTWLEEDEGATLSVTEVPADVLLESFKIRGVIR